LELKAYVTGATGCVGRNLIDALLSSGWDTTVLHRKTSDLSRLDECNVKFREVNLYDLESVRSAIPEDVNALFHVAGSTSYWWKDRKQQWKDNVLATRNLVHIAIEKKVGRFIFTSTGATWSYHDTVKTHREAKKKIGISYVRTKRMAEIEIEQGIKSGLDAVILNPVIVLGKYDYSTYSSLFTGINRGKIKKALPGQFAFCHAEDVARAHVQAYKHGKPGQRYCLDGPWATWLEVFWRIARLAGSDPIIETIPVWQVRLTSYAMVFWSFFSGKRPLLTPEISSLLVSDNKHTPELWEMTAITREDLDYRSRPISNMIEDCYSWMAENDRL